MSLLLPFRQQTNAADARIVTRAQVSTSVLLFCDAACVLRVIALHANALMPPAETVAFNKPMFCS